MNRICIYFWHGTISKSQQDKLNKMGLYEEDHVKYINLSLNEFADKWNDKFLAYPPSQHSLKNDYWLVGVTKHSTFESR